MYNKKGINLTKKELIELFDIPTSETKNRFLDFPSSKLNDVVREAAIYEKIILKNETKPNIEKEAREILVKFYSDDVKKLKELLKYDLPWSDFFGKLA